MTARAREAVAQLGVATREFLDAPHRFHIGGDWVTGAGREIVVENPTTGLAIASLRSASLDQLDAQSQSWIC
jgi:hypothetical protein